MPVRMALVGLAVVLFVALGAAFASAQSNGRQAGHHRHRQRAARTVSTPRQSLAR
jgi:hypothetical protein